MFSVIIPACDRPRQLAEALACVAAQQRPPEEVIVVDNGTQPVSLPEPESLAVRHMRAPVRAGAAQARNLGAALARYPWLAFLDDDDTWSENYLASVAWSIRCAPHVRLHLARVCVIDPCGRVRLERLYGHQAPGRAVLYKNPGIVGSNIVVHRDTFLQLGGFDVRLPASEDRALLWRFLRAEEPVAANGERTAYVRAHRGERLSADANLALGKLAFLRHYGADMSVGERARGLALAAYRGCQAALRRLRRA